MPRETAAPARTHLAENGAAHALGTEDPAHQIQEGTSTGIRYRLEGELVPVLHMALDGSVPVYFEHHVLLWKYPELKIGLHPLRKGLGAARVRRHAAAAAAGRVRRRGRVQP